MHMSRNWLFWSLALPILVIAALATVGIVHVRGTPPLGLVNVR
jgi:hypothetical protein